MKNKKVFLFLVPLILGMVVSLLPQQKVTQVADAATSSGKTPEEYESWINSWGKDGHFYFHYNRGDAASDADYNRYCLWLWQHAPQDLEGGLWGYKSNPVISPSLTLKPMTTRWMTEDDVLGNGSQAMYIDEYGAMMDVELYKQGLVGGKSGEAMTYVGTSNMGFLFVVESSMGGDTNWTSDGGKENYIENFDVGDNWRQSEAGKFIHVFTSSGNLDKQGFTCNGAPVPRENPIDKDTTGKYRSQVATISDKYPGQVPATSDDMSNCGVGYQIFVASFRDTDGDGMGDLQGVIQSLDYLESLNVDSLWLTPIQQSDSYHGYDISDYYAVDRKFGSVKDYQELIYKAHEKGMRVFMDLVLNHTSKSNVWFTKSQWGEKGTIDGKEFNWRDVYTWKYKTDQIYKYKNGSYQLTTVQEDALSDNPSWYRDGESNYYYYGKFGSGMPEINYQNEATRKLVIDMAKYWMSFGLDGFRLDAVKHIFMRDEVNDVSGDIIITDVGSKESYDDEKGKYVTKDFDYSSDLTKNVQWWKEFSHDIKAVYPDCFLVGENFDGWGTRIAPYYQALDSQFDFSLYYHTVGKIYENGSGNIDCTYLKGEKNENDNVFSASISNYFPLGDTGISVPGGGRPSFIGGAFTSNHDVMRAINHVNGTYVSATDTKDKDKVTGTATEIGRAKTDAAIKILHPGITWIYYGDELGMSSNTDGHIAKYGNENCMDIWYRQPFKWAPDDTITIGGKVLSVIPSYKSGRYEFEWDSYNKTIKDVEAQDADENSMLNWYRALTEVKAMYPKGAKYNISDSTNQDIFVLDIMDAGGNAKFKIFINPGVEGASYGVSSAASGYTFLKAIGQGAAKDNISHAYTVLVYKK